MDIASQSNRKTRRWPRPTALGTLASIGVIAIFSSMIAGPIIGWRYYQQTKLVALSKTATDAWNAHWAEAKDASGKPMTAPALQGIVNYPQKAFLFLYQDPATGKVAAMSWMSNQEIRQAALKDVWVPLAVQEQAPPPAAPEAGK